MARTIFVGDVHGCADEFARLLDRVSYAQGSDVLYQVGDLVARGPDSHGAVVRARESGARVVRGNHDEKLLSFWRVMRARGRDAANATVTLSPRHQLALSQLTEDDLAWLDALPFSLEVPSHGVRVVHAGLDPRVPIEKQEPFLMMNLRSIDEAGKPTRQLVATPWARAWPGPEHVVFGHDARRGIQIEAHATGLDSGCCYGRALTALVLDAGESVPSDPVERAAHLVQEPAQQTWCPMGDGHGPE